MDALRDAGSLAGAVDEGLSGRRELDAALAAYHRKRDETVGPMYELNYQLTALQVPPPETQQLFAAMRDNPEAIFPFLGVLTDAVRFRRSSRRKPRADHGSQARNRIGPARGCWKSP